MIIITIAKKNYNNNDDNYYNDDGNNLSIPLIKVLREQFKKSVCKNIFVLIKHFTLSISYTNKTILWHY